MHKLPFYCFITPVILFTALCPSRIFARPSADSIKHWVGTWACAPYAAGTNTPPSPGLTNNTLRQIVKVSIGGDTLRVKFSNVTSPSAVTMNSVNIAASKGGKVIDAATMKTLKFNGNTSVTINAGSETVSDPVAFNLIPGMNLAITIYYGQCQTSPDMTHHYGSRTDSYILSGDKTSSSDFGGATSIERWYTISGIDVLAPLTTYTVAAIGNSITDGYGVHNGPSNKWTDFFAQKLLSNDVTAQVGVLNMGIGATTVLGNGPTTGVSRFQKDILEQPGVKWIICLYGTNDIGKLSGASAATSKANDLINTFKDWARKAHEKDIIIYGGTITPFKGHEYYTVDAESCRKAVNNAIRSGGIFDGVIDFDRIIRDPADTTKMRADLRNDWLHPNAEGYKVMGESIDLSLFTPPPVAVNPNEAAKSRSSSDIGLQVVKDVASISFDLPDPGVVSINMYSLSGAKVASISKRQFSSGKHTEQFDCSNWTRGMYLYSIATCQSVSVGKLIVSGR
ncbi:MAG: SGNH/GDSL hydrolase family protein [Fibrobacter sp.]|nr:SGNH/GDSL hydrolase family protein [Fibrobacter sp.]